MKKILSKKEQKFVSVVWKYYKAHGRLRLPWRNLPADRQGRLNPYRILVSEIMLQQTQVDRVIPKYKSFLKHFPTFKKLSEASLGDVLREWQGLGYNRRAKLLHECAKEITQKCRGRGAHPKSYDELMRLPGIGPYTAGAVMAFAYNEAVPIIETNIRTVFIHHFFPGDTDIPDKQLFQLTGIVLDRKNPREWYWALMDYGAHLKKTIGNQNQRSKHYAKQSTFKNSDRQIRGMILRALTAHEESRVSLHKKLPFDIQRIDVQLERLIEEEMIAKKKSMYELP